MKKRIANGQYFALLFILFLSLDSTSLIASQNNNDLPKVFLENFKPIKVFKYGRYFGSIRPKYQTVVYSPIAGSVDDLSVRPGQKVKKGQVIGKIKAIDIAGEMRPMSIKSPINGIVSGNLPNIGQYINKHQNVVSIYKDGTFVSTINVAFQDAKAVRIGHPVEITVDEKKYKGSILSIGQLLDPVTGTVVMEIELQSKNSIIRPGIVTENLIKYENKESLALPRKYIHQIGDKKVVYTVEKNSEETKLKAIDIEVDGRFKDLLKITTKQPMQELNIVTKSTLKHLSEGTTVELTNPAPPKQKIKVNDKNEKNDKKGSQ